MRSNSHIHARKHAPVALRLRHDCPAPKQRPTMSAWRRVAGSTPALRILARCACLSARLRRRSARGHSYKRVTHSIARKEPSLRKTLKMAAVNLCFPVLPTRTYGVTKRFSHSPWMYFRVLQPDMQEMKIDSGMQTRLHSTNHMDAHGMPLVGGGAGCTGLRRGAGSLKCPLRAAARALERCILFRPLTGCGSNITRSCQRKSPSLCACSRVCLSSEWLGQ